MKNLPSAVQAKQQLTASCLAKPLDNQQHDEKQQDARGTGGKLELQRQVGLMSGVGIVVGVIVGSGIFITPRDVLMEAGSEGAALVVWLLSGLLSMFGALSFAELGASIESSGGDYAYILMAYGPLTAFLYLWVIVLVILPCSNAIGALTFAKYAIKAMSSLRNVMPSTSSSSSLSLSSSSSSNEQLNLSDKNKFTNATSSFDLITNVTSQVCLPSQQTSILFEAENATRCLALAILLMLLYINCRSIKYSIKLQSTFTLAKVIALAAIIVIGFYYAITNKGTNLVKRRDLFDGTKANIPSLVLAFYSAIYTFSGWNSLNFITEEIKDPPKNMPRAIFLSLGLVTVIYCLANVAFSAVLTKDEILNNDTVASTFATKTLGNYDWLMTLSVAASATSGLNGLLFASSRILFVGARQGQLFSLLNMISVKHLTPIPSILFMGIISALYLSITSIGTLINYLVFIEAMFSALAVSTVLVLRRKYPNLPRPIKVHWTIPTAYLIMSAILVVLPIWREPFNAAIGSVILVIGIPVYMLTANWKNKPRRYQEAIDKLNTTVQKLTLVVTPESDVKII